MKTALVLGGHGFIGHHLAKRLMREDYSVETVDIKHFEYGSPFEFCHEFTIADLRNERDVANVITNYDEVYCFAALMGGAETIFVGDYDAQILNDNLLIALNVAHAASVHNIKKVWISSSACAYNHGWQSKKEVTPLQEHMAYPSWPDSDYGWAKIMEERIFQAYSRVRGLNIRIGRFHNIFGEEGEWDSIKAKAPAALCRKVAMADDGDEIEVLGDGTQLRTFLYIDECVEGIRRLMNSNYSEPLNIGSSEVISINDLAKMIIGISGKKLTIKNIASKAIGVHGRSSDNTKIKEVLNWQPTAKLYDGLVKIYKWIEQQVNKQK